MMNEINQPGTKSGADRNSKPIALINAEIASHKKSQSKSGGMVMENGIITDFGPHLRRNAPDGADVIDCNGHTLCPGLVDMQVYTGEPGQEHRETLATASRAAAAGGVTTIICMPNTDPVIDDVALVDFMQRRARDTAIVHVYPMAAMTKGLKSVEMSEIGLLKSAGAAAFSNGKSSIQNAHIMRQIMCYAKDFDALIVHHTEDPDLASRGVMNEGEIATRLGLPGIPCEAEMIMLERDIRLVSLTGARYHAAQISCRGSLEIIRRAKEQGLPVTCGVSINHLTLNENDIGPYRTFFKIKPPLRSEDDRRAMIEGIASGDIDVIHSSHDPQDVDVKRRPFIEASDGAIGLETLLPAALRLVHNEDLSLNQILRALCKNPADILGLPCGRLDVGAPADLALVDLNTPWVVDPAHMQAKSKNTPFDEQRLQGRVLRSFVAGREVYDYSAQ